MVESEWSIIIFSKYFKIQFAWPTFQKRSWTVMTIMSTNRKKYKCLGNTIDGNIFNKHNDQEKKTLVKGIFLTCMEFIQFKLLCFNLILQFWRWKVFPQCLCTLWIYKMTSLVSCCARIVNQNKWSTLLQMSR
jgi:hypothetical protein